MKQFLAALMVLGFASSTLAQGPGGRGFGGGGVLGLLSIPEVQRELTMSEGQKEKFRSLRGEGGDQQTLTREERQKLADELAKRADDLVKKEFSEQQQQRLSELRIQREGASSLARMEVAEKLGLDQAQKDQIAKIQSENTPNARPNFQNATQEEREKWMAEARERREKTDAALVAVLTDAQKEAWEKLQGTKFTFPQQQGRRRGQ
jgi:hypothetical protein